RQARAGARPLLGCGAVVEAGSGYNGPGRFPRSTKKFQEEIMRKLVPAYAAVLGAAAIGLAAPVPVAAQAWPTKSVRMVVPFGAGGPADLFARFLAQRLQEALGQPFVVEDRPGAGSIIGTEVVAKSAADGYTLLVMSNTHTVNETLVPKKPFALMKDFVPVAPVNYSDLVLVVHPSVPAKTVKELIQLAKVKPRGMNYASSGTGTPYHMAGELFKALAGGENVAGPPNGSAE